MMLAPLLLLGLSQTDAPLPTVPAPHTVIFFGPPSSLLQFALAARACGIKPRAAPTKGGLAVVALDVITADDPATPAGCAAAWWRKHENLGITPARSGRPGDPKSKPTVGW